ncbi:MAG TPA: PAS domain S-box protein [Gemmatimonadaceae bacterium]|nr:PAS domain S-box protein [Gemmatimonadaceae bacterium]
MTEATRGHDAGDFSESDAAALLAGLPPEKAQAVRALLRERGRLSERCRRVIETTSDAVVITNRDRAIAFANPAAHSLFGFPGSQLVGKRVADIVPAEVRGAIAEHESAALSGAPQHYETVVLRADGECRAVSVSTAPLREGSEGGEEEITGVVASLRDITNERRASDAVARSEARYQRLVETAPDAIFTVDMDGNLTSVNRAFEDALGRGREELVGISFTELLDGSQRHTVRQLLAATAAGRRSQAEIRYRDMRGELCTGSVTATPVVEDGEIRGCLGIVRDVTGERRLADQLLQREKLAAVGQLVSGVAHELNNPLAGVLAFAQLLEAAPGNDAEQREAVRAIHKEAKRAAKIVSNLLLFARDRDPERTRTDLNAVMIDALELRRYVLRTQQVEVVTELDSSLPAVWADPFQLQQVVLNFITNAEYALKGVEHEKRITLRTWFANDRVYASVADNGTGIEAEVIDRVFNPFFTTKEVGEGTGLGLSISHGIIRQHGGHIGVESVPGNGATFTIDLPLSPLASAKPESATAGSRRGSASSTFLIVDDEPSIRRALVRYLMREGHAVDTAASGEEALAQMAGRRYDAILLDLRMPDMAGQRVFQRLREEDPEHAARVVFATGDSDSEGTHDFLREAERPFVSKPFMLPSVVRLLCDVAAYHVNVNERSGARRMKVTNG